jgi:hypothetical protein
MNRRTFTQSLAALREFVRFLWWCCDLWPTPEQARNWARSSSGHRLEMQP